MGEIKCIKKTEFVGENISIVCFILSKQTSIERYEIKFIEKRSDGIIFYEKKIKPFLEEKLKSYPIHIGSHGN